MTTPGRSPASWSGAAGSPGAPCPRTAPSARAPRSSGAGSWASGTCSSTAAAIRSLLLQQGMVTPACGLAGLDSAPGRPGARAGRPPGASHRGRGARRRPQRRGKGCRWRGRSPPGGCHTPLGGVAPWPSTTAPRTSPEGDPAEARAEALRAQIALPRRALPRPRRPRAARDAESRPGPPPPGPSRRTIRSWSPPSRRPTGRRAAPPDRRSPPSSTCADDVARQRLQRGGAGGLGRPPPPAGGREPPPPPPFFFPPPKKIARRARLRLRAEDRRRGHVAALRGGPVVGPPPGGRPGGRGRHRERPHHRRRAPRLPGRPTVLEVRGEVYMPVSAFEALNERQAEAGPPVREPTEHGSRLGAPEGPEVPPARTSLFATRLVTLEGGPGLRTPPSPWPG